MADTHQDGILNRLMRPVKLFIEKASPVSVKTVDRGLSILGFKFIPKLINNTFAKKDPYVLTDWVGVFVALSSGGFAVRYGGYQGFKYWFIAQGVGNTIGEVIYSIQ